MKGIIDKQKFLPLSIPVICGNEWKYIKECLDTGWVSSAGNFVDKFEEKIGNFVKIRYAVACVNGTAALQVALQLAGVSRGDEVIVPAVTFIAPVNAVKYLSAEPVFMDCDDFYNIDIDKTVQFIKEETTFKGSFSYNRKTKRLVRALIPVHVFGNAVDLERIILLCKKRNIKVIEDATESLGTYYISGIYKDCHTGTLGDIGCYSFNGNKIITTGGGGMIVTDNSEWAEKARYLTTQAKDDEVRHVHNEIGYNFRLTNIQAAMGVAQLEQLPEFIEIKKKNYGLYKKELNKIDGLKVADIPEYARNNYWMYALQVDKTRYPKDKYKLLQFLQKNGVQSRPLWHLNHLQKPYKNNQSYYIEKAYKMAETTLNIPCSTNLTLKDLQRVICLLKQVKRK